MRILWITNTIFPYPREYLGLGSNPFGGWLLGQFNYIKKEKSIKLAIASVYNGNKLMILEKDMVVYYLLPKKNDLKINFKIINNEFKPDLVHIHGSEFNYGNEFQKANPNTLSIVSIQGLVSVISNFYTANIQKKDIKPTIRDLIRGNIYKEQNNFKKRGLIEEDTLKRAKAIIGRTTWDYANSYYITNELKYYHCNESLRDIFYDTKWNINNVERHSIYLSQANYPIKGLHIILKALCLLKYKYNDIKLYIAGANILDNSTFKKRIKATGYSKYLLNLVKKYNLRDNIIFTGIISEYQVAEYLKKCHVYVQCSSIENSPNSLGEAMLIGMPCIASYVGGTMDLLNSNEEGYLYPFGDYGLLAYYIDKVFSNDKDAIRIGENAQKHAKITHNREKNAKMIIDIYKKVLNSSEK